MRYILVLIGVLVIHGATAQELAGFQLLEKVSTARVAGLGGYSSSLSGDISSFFQNPAGLDSSTVGQLSATYNPFFADIQGVFAQYGFQLKQIPLAAGIRYLDYGDFDQTDATGALTGTFQARDYVISLGGSHRVGPFSLGSNVHYIYSGIAGYSASALAMDFGGQYLAPTADLVVGMTVRNIGLALTDFTDLSPELPTQWTVGISFKPEEMPIRFTFTGHDLVSDVQNETQTEAEPNVLDQVFTRVVAGAEIIFSKHVHALLGYDHRRKQELRLEETGGGAGFSYGVLIRIKQFDFRYARTTYQAAGGTSFITITTQTKTLGKRF